MKTLLFVPFGFCIFASSVFSQKFTEQQTDERTRFTVKCQDRYFLGETPAITLSIANTGPSPIRVNELDLQNFTLGVYGVFEHNKELAKAIVWSIPKPLSEPKPIQLVVLRVPGQRGPKYVTLAPEESTDLPMDLAKTLAAKLDTGNYKLTVKFEAGPEIVKEFEVYFDDEKSVPVLAKMLESNDDSARNWAAFSLARFNRPKLVELLEALVKSGNEKQREFARVMLAQIKAAGNVFVGFHISR